LKLILLSGGSGKRLWPLSNDARSKQFLKVLHNEEDKLESMVQRVWGQLRKAELLDSTFIATMKSQVDMIQNQLGSEVEIIVEPERRDTFPAIALASTYLYTKKQVDLDEVVIVLPVDPYVEGQFFSRIKDLENELLYSKADLALMGVKPTFPSEKYGYIVPEPIKEGNPYIKVNSFQEKPSEKKAIELINKNAFWNCGIFAFRLGFVIGELIKQGFPIEYDILKEAYQELPKISFDYQVVEKTKDIVVLPYDGKWKDLGTWNTLTEEMSSSLVGQGYISDDSENTNLVNELDIPIIVLGLSNIVVAASPDGILVSDKSASPRVKDAVSRFNHRPMYEERRWGWYKVLDQMTYPNGDEVLTKRVGIMAGKNLSYHIHYQRNEVWTIVQGEGEFVINDEIYTVKPGDVLQIPEQSKHAIRAVTDLELIQVQTGTELLEEDIMSLSRTWEDIVEQCIRERTYQTTI
jgi:mannose-1-phosphate guanylyltransferase